jgi:hypothetical protein
LEKSKCFGKKSDEGIKNGFYWLMTPPLIWFVFWGNRENVRVSNWKNIVYFVSLIETGARGLRRLRNKKNCK